MVALVVVLTLIIVTPMRTNMLTPPVPLVTIVTLRVTRTVALVAYATCPVLRPPGCLGGGAAKSTAAICPLCIASLASSSRRRGRTVKSAPQ